MTARALFAALVLAVLPASADSPPDTATALEMRDAIVEDLSDRGLAVAIAEARASADAPVWVAYQVAGVPRHGSLCCNHGSCCQVESADDSLTIRPASDDGPVAVLIRFAGSEAGRIRILSLDCPVSFGGHRVLWAGEVTTRESLELLTGWLEDSSKRVSRGALTAVAYHDDAGATGLLESLALANEDDELSREAIFWLGVARQQEGLDSLRRLLAADLDIERQKAVVFALSQSPISAAHNVLTRLARSDPRADVRSEVLFWLGQDETGAASELIYQAAVADESPSVAKQAVFVLSQLPEPLNVELLARLLTQHERPELRKEALFWIGQADSEEALEIVAHILNE